ncbi:transcriptional regulator, IclR family [Alkalispirochaeta americana]|uniref:Transcriptional regulator, IclR family n=1 Tax=Alkalispirochaeta americana TaxID=159291 RepID=A0A1N6YA40_9SPIO|nr:IclR family transcriptional regulator [Alkalispirochaeta americana]SIR11502.1 transcriptional regulator, IclR family [Alkalispirochaeta americana]
MAGRKSDVASVKAVIKTISILEGLAQCDQVGVTEIATATGMSKATAFRFLATLEQLGYVQQDVDQGYYSLTLKLFEVAGIVRARRTKLDDVRPVLQALAEATHETIHLATLEIDHLVYLYKIESTLSLKVSMHSEVGRSAPLYCTGLGKVMLAYQPPKRRDQLVHSMDLHQHTPLTITNPDALQAELTRITETGYALDNEEHEIGVRCIAAPIRNSTGEVIAALSISVPSVRLTNDKMEEYRTYVLNTAERISEIVGTGSWRG